jgi:phosphoribosyl-AMP cyclohydrolase
MKASLLVALLLFFSADAISQVLKFKATAFSSRSKTGKTWTKWSSATESSVLIVFNTEKDRITIYSKETQVYDIYQEFEKVVDKD